MFVKIDTTPNYGGLRVEVTFRLMAYFAVPKSEEMIIDYTKAYPESRPLYLILRSLARRSQIDDPSNGGFNTLSLFLLIIAFCQKFGASGRLEGDSSADSQITSDQVPNQPAKFESLRAKIARKKAATDEPKVQTSIGEMLLGLLSFYAFTFDYANFLVYPFLPSEKYRDPFQKVALLESRPELSIARDIAPLPISNQHHQSIPQSPQT